MLKLATPLDIDGNPNLGIICVPEYSSSKGEYFGKIGIAAGWGWTKPDGSEKPDKLQKVNLPVVDINWCKKMYNLEDEYMNTMICTYELGKDTCHVSTKLF